MVHLLVRPEEVVVVVGVAAVLAARQVVPGRRFAPRVGFVGFVRFPFPAVVFRDPLVRLPRCRPFIGQFACKKELWVVRVPVARWR